MISSGLWFADVMLAISMMIIMAGSVARLRTIQARQSSAVAFCLFLYFLCAVASAGHDYAIRQIENLTIALNNPAPPTHLSADWGASLNKEQRTAASQILARNTFENSGIIVDYIDLSRKLIPFEPTQKDRLNRAAYLGKIEQTVQSASLLVWASLGWLLVPLLGIGIGFTSWPKRLTNPSIKPPESSPLN